MSLKNLYANQKTKTNAVNEAGGRAYDNSPEWKLTKLVTTGMLSNTYYVSAENVNKTLIELANKVSPEFLAKTLVYARENGYMRSNPIQLLVLLSVRSPALFRKVFKRIVRTGGDVLDFATVVLSGEYRQGWGTAPRTEMRNLLNEMDAYQYIKYGSDRQNPSMKDVLKLVRPTPKDDQTNALFHYMMGKEVEMGRLPVKVQEYQEFISLDPGNARRIELLATGHLPHEVVTAHNLTPEEWLVLAQHMPYMATLRNLNTMNRQGVFGSKEAVKVVASKIGNAEIVAKSKQFPYRFLSAYLASEDNIPQTIKTAIGQALEVATRNVPAIDGTVVVGADVSGSMSGHVSQKSKVRYVDVAALVSAAIKRQNPDAHIVPFDTQNHRFTMDANDTVMTNAQKLARFGGGGTDTSLPFQYVLDRKLAKELKLLVAVTDDMSWFSSGWYSRNTDSMELWKQIRRINPNAQALLINVAPYTTDQMREHTEGITFVSGFSDDVFRLMGTLTEGGIGNTVDTINKVVLD